METFVQLSFYCFAAGSIAAAAAWLCYVVFGVGKVRVQRTQLATTAGTSVTASTAEFGPGPEAIGRFGSLLAWFATILMGLSVAFRTIASERGPYSNMYEFSLAFIFVLLLVYLIFERKYEIKHLGGIVMTIVVAMSLYVWSLPADMREINPLNPALQNRPLMTLHVSTAILAYATFAVSFAAAILFLFQTKRNVGWLPSADMLDDIGYRAVTIGFPMLALVLILGSIWAHQAWGAYWSWDPKETAALFTWLVYGVYLHTRSLRGWRGTRSAIVLLIGFGAVVFTYYGNYFFGGMHAYGGVN